MQASLPSGSASTQKGGAPPRGTGPCRRPRGWASMRRGASSCGTRDVDVDPVALRPRRRPSAWKPDRGPLAQRVDQAVSRPRTRRHSRAPPSRNGLIRGDVQRVDADLQRLDRPRSGRRAAWSAGTPSRGPRAGRAQLRVACRHPARLGGLQRQQEPVGADVHPQVAPRRRASARRPARPRRPPAAATRSATRS